MMKIEVWRGIIGYEGLYEVSDFGNVRSIDRTVVCKDGRKRHYKGVMLKPVKREDGYRQVYLYKNGVQKSIIISIFVARAFPEICGEWFDGAQVDHIIPVMNGGTDEATNLRVCTHPQNCNNPITRKNISEAKKGEKAPMWGKFGAEHSCSKPILQYSKEGVLIKEWDCARDVSRELGINYKNISECCLGKRKSAGGYVWKYKKEAG